MKVRRGAHEVLLHGGKGYVSGTMYFRASLACFVQGVSFWWGVDSPLGFPLLCPALGLGEVLQVSLHVRALCLMELVLPIGERVLVLTGVLCCHDPVLSRGQVTLPLPFLPSD